MKKIIISLCVLGFVGAANAHDTPKVRAKNHTCAELQEIVQEHGTVLITGFGSRYVHSDEDVCNGAMNEIANRSNWPTKDKFACFAGYYCTEESSR